MNQIAMMLAWRYVTRSMYEQSLSIMVAISFIGIFIGSCALALVGAIMHGFDVETRKQMQGIHPQAIIKSEAPLDIAALNAVLFSEFPCISATSPTSTAFGLAQIDQSNTKNPLVIMISAIDPTTAPQVNSLQEKILHHGNLTSINEPNTVIIGSSLAEKNDITCGDTFDILFASDQQPHKKKLVFNSHTVTIGGIIKTGYEDMDNSIVLCSFDLFDTLFPDIGFQELQLKFNNTVAVNSCIQQLQERTQLEVYTWQDLYPALLAALTLEEYVSLLVIALITLVASMNILALLFMQITNKRTDIALLKTIGLADNIIIRIFIYMGVGIALCASVCGIVCATILSFCIDHYKLFPLPDAYYVSHVPAHMTIVIPIFVLLLVCIMSLCATIIPLWQLRKFSVSTILRFEG